MTPIILALAAGVTLAQLGPCPTGADIIDGQCCSGGSCVPLHNQIGPPIIITNKNAAPPQCDPGWSLVTIGSAPWCARELRSPK